MEASVGASLPLLPRALLYIREVTRVQLDRLSGVARKPDTQAARGSAVVRPVLAVSVDVHGGGRQNARAAAVVDPLQGRGHGLARGRLREHVVNELDGLPHPGLV